MKMRPLPLFALFVCCIPLMGCATILEGQKQTISINSEPNGALCDVHRSGKLIANLYTPATFTVYKSHNNLIVRCQKPYYQPVTGVDASQIQGWIFGNLVFGDFIGTIVDLSTAADSVYGETIRVSLPKLDPANKDIIEKYREIGFEAN